MICPSCKTENPDRAKFCIECGSSLRAGAPAVAEASPHPDADVNDEAAPAVARGLAALVPEVSPGFVASFEPDPAASDEDPSLKPAAPASHEGLAFEVPASEPAAHEAAAPTSSPAASVASEARSLFGPKEPSPSAEVTADLSGLERLVDSSYVPPTFSGRAGDTMEMPRIEDDAVAQPRSFRAEVDPKEARRQQKARKKLEREQAKRERELLRQGVVAPATPAAEAAHEGASSEGADESGSSDPHAAGEPRSAGFRRPKRAGLIALLIVVVLAAATAGVTYALELWGGRAVPDVIGRSQVDATSALQERGFTPVVVQVKSDDVEGIILSTDPAPGRRAEAGSEVVMGVSVARTVPDVIGKTQDEALALMGAEGFEEVTYTPVKSNEAEGTVLSVSPEVGTTAKAATPITVEVAMPYTVPDVEGMSTEQATEALEAEGYVVSVEWYRTEEISEGTAVSTSPEAGQKLASGSDVVLYVAHNRSTELVSLTRAFFTDSPLMVINGVNYEVSEVTSVSYAGNDACSFSIVARPYETHTWMFGLGSETRYGSYETIKGSMTWNDDNDIVSVEPSMKQGAL